MLASCANIKNDQTRTKAEGAGGGAVAGAILGGLLGGWRGAAIGAAAGGAVGYGVGAHVASKKAKYKNQEAWLSACIAQAQSVNSSARAQNARLSARINDLESQINAARSGNNKGQLRQLKRAVLSLRTENSNEYKRVTTEITQQSTVVNQVGNTAGGMTLNTQVTELRSTQSSLSQNETRIADLLRRVDA
jgi:hypothetical protein